MSCTPAGSPVIAILSTLFLLRLEYRAPTHGCGIATRNQRLAAIHSFARFIGLHSPEHLEWCGQIQAIASKKVARRLVVYLEKDELDALLKALHDFGCAGRLLCESPIMEEDALLFQKKWIEISGESVEAK